MPDVAQNVTADDDNVVSDGKDVRRASDQTGFAGQELPRGTFNSAPCPIRHGINAFRFCFPGLHFHECQKVTAGGDEIDFTQIGPVAPG